MQISTARLPEFTWRTAIIALLLASLLVPLIVGYDFFFPYVAPRNIFFRVAIEVGAAALVLALSFGRKSLDLRGEPIFWSLVAFLAAASVSALLSPAPAHSFFGDFERMGGVWAWIHLVLFFLLLRTLRDQDWSWVLNSALVVSLVVGAIAIGQHFGLATGARSADTIAVASTSTLGNSGLLAAYLLMNIALAGYLAATSERYRLLYFLAGGANLLALIYAENRSTVIGLVLGAMVGGFIFAMVSAPSRRKWIALALAASLAVVLAGLTAGIRAFPGAAMTRHVPEVLQRLASTNPTGSDQSRTMQWRAAIDGFKDRPLLGYGLENHNLVWSAHFDPGIYRLDTDIYDRTHNQFLETLATTGLIGMVAFLGIWIAIAVTLVRAYRAGRLSVPGLGVLSGLQVAYATYLFFWFFDLNSAMLWILVAALVASRGTVGSVVLEASGHPAEEAMTRPILALASVVVLAATIYGEGYMPLRANHALAAIDSRRASTMQILPEFDVLSNSALRQSTHAPLIMEQYIGSLRPRMKEMRADSSERRMLDRAFTETFAVFGREIHRDTLNDRLYEREGALLDDAAQFYESPSYR